MKCNCLDEFNAWIKEESGDPSACVPTETFIYEGKLCRIIPIVMQFKDIRKRDKKLGLRRKHNMLPPYCPQCGKINEVGLSYGYDE